MQIVSLGDNLHGLSDPVFWGKKKGKKNIISFSLSSVEFANSMVGIKGLAGFPMT